MRWPAILLRLKVTIAYSVLAATAAILVGHLGPHAQWHVLLRASTNLRNLGDGHVGATVLVAAGLFVGIHADWLEDSLAVAVDVGVSYAAAAVAGSLIRYLRGPWRVLWAGGWLALVGASAIADPSFTAFGHATALCIGLTLGGYFLHHDAKALRDRYIADAATESVHPTSAMTSL
ncbi:hypothetical protein CH300_03025 [Rhodococcus sp. 15-1154-1]|nr:rhomboid-like protein [Rhodococcus sp. 15-1154-1]OZF08882.1 hypothetical protein CH300_03025 [Rhodococcus sp. 15-1154-1]